MQEVDEESLLGEKEPACVQCRTWVPLSKQFYPELLAEDGRGHVALHGLIPCSVVQPLCLANTIPGMQKFCGHI